MQLGRRLDGEAIRSSCHAGAASEADTGVVS